MTLMTTTEDITVAGELLKMDVLGRVKVKAEHREAMLDAFEASGMSGQAFAIHHGIKVQTFITRFQTKCPPIQPKGSGVNVVVEHILLADIEHGGAQDGEIQGGRGEILVGVRIGEVDTELVRDGNG